MDFSNSTISGSSIEFGESITVSVSETSPSISITAIVSPTLTTSSFSNKISIKVPATSLGTSESTLSVAISTTASSNSIESPMSFNQAVMVASATLSPIFGNFNSNLAICIWFNGCKNTKNR